jgi:hypothetical protein
MAEQARGKTKVAMGAVHPTGEPLVSIAKTQNISFISYSETKLRGTVCGKSARTDLRGSSEAMSRSTRTLSIASKKTMNSKVFS